MRKISVVALLLLVPALALGQGEGAPGAGPAFNHRAHLGNAPECAECHRAGDLSVVPDLARCDKCHEKGRGQSARIPGTTTHDSFWYRDHEAAARAPLADCAFCHDQKSCEDCHRAGFADQAGKINIHRGDFRVTHPILAKADGRSCRSCHAEAFCTDCHARFARGDLAFQSHRRGWSDVLGGSTAHADFAPDSCLTCHTPGTVLGAHEWTNSHSREARRNLPTCQSCHPGGEVCLRCHSAREGLIVNPHPKDWNDMKENLNKASGGKTCRRCH